MANPWVKVVAVVGLALVVLQLWMVLMVLQPDDRGVCMRPLAGAPSNTADDPNILRLVKSRRANSDGAGVDVGTGIRGVDRIYCITLEKREPHKKTRMSALVKALGIKVDWVAAIDSKEIQTMGTSWDTQGAAIDMVQQIKDEPRLGWNAVACWQSHLRLLRRIRDRNETAIVLEDDVDFDIDFVTKVERIISTRLANKTWHMVRLGGCYEAQRGAPLDDLLRRSDSYACTHAYLVHGSEAASRILQQIDEPSLTCGFDVWMSVTMNSRSKGWRSYSCFPQLVNQVSKHFTGRRKTMQGMIPLANSTVQAIEDALFLRPSSSFLGLPLP